MRLKKPTKPTPPQITLPQSSAKKSMSSQGSTRTALDNEDEDDFEIPSPRQARLPPPTKKPRDNRDEPDEDAEGDGGEETSEGYNYGGMQVGLLPGVSKTTLRRVRTMFGQRSTTIIEMLEQQDTDPAAALITRTLLQTLVDVLPVVERGVRKSKGTRGVLPLNQCISQMREILHDLQAYKDRSMLGQTIVDRSIRPAYLDLAVQVSNLFVEQENWLRTRLGKDEFERFQGFNLEMKRSLSQFIQAQYKDVSESVVRSV